MSRKLKLLDVVSRGAQIKVADRWLPLLAQETYQVRVTETVLGYYGYRRAEAGHASKEPLGRGDIMVRDVEIRAEAKLADKRKLYSIKVVAGVIYELVVNGSDQEVDKESKIRALRHARGFLRNRVLEELASLRIEPIPFHRELLGNANAKTETGSP